MLCRPAMSLGYWHRGGLGGRATMLGKHFSDLDLHLLENRRAFLSTKYGCTLLP